MGAVCCKSCRRSDKGYNINNELRESQRRYHQSPNRASLTMPSTSQITTIQNAIETSEYYVTIVHGDILDGNFVLIEF